MPQTIHKPVAAAPEQERSGELVPPSDLRSAIISVNPGRLSGTPCFTGTRIPIKNLWDCLEAGDSLDEFLEGFPGVSREQAILALHTSFDSLLKGLPEGVPVR